MTGAAVRVVNQLRVLAAMAVRFRKPVFASEHSRVCVAVVAVVSSVMIAMSLVDFSAGSAVAVHTPGLKP